MFTEDILDMRAGRPKQEVHLNRGICVAWPILGGPHKGKYLRAQPSSLGYGIADLTLVPHDQAHSLRRALTGIEELGAVDCNSRDFHNLLKDNEIPLEYVQSTRYAFYDWADWAAPVETPKNAVACQLLNGLAGKNLSWTSMQHRARPKGWKIPKIEGWPYQHVYTSRLETGFWLQKGTSQGWRSNRAERTLVLARNTRKFWRFSLETTWKERDDPWLFLERQKFGTASQALNYAISYISLIS